MPRISVVIPCYNVEEYISECLDSVLNQTFKDLEIICVEDCSTDKTKDILQKYAKKYIKMHIIYNKKNQGLAISRNIGVKNSSCDYIYFLDSDDSISQDCIEKLYNEIEQDKCDLVVGSVNVYAENPNNEFCLKRSKFLQDFVKIEYISKLKITEENSGEYYSKIYCCAWNKLYKKSFLIDNDIYFINEKCFHEDNGFWLKVLTCNPVINTIPSQTYFYRIRNSSITEMTDSDKNLRRLHLKNSLKDALNFAKKKNNKPLSNFIYYEIYKLSKHRFLYFVWTKCEKRIRILFLPIFSLDERKLKILGIPVYKRRIK